MTRVQDVMSPTPTTLGRNDQLRIADDLMHAERIRHLPVLNEQNEVVGVVSQRDLFQSGLLRALGFGSASRDRVLTTVLVKEVMTKEVVVTTPETPLANAARVMVDRKVGCLPVVKEGTLVGILTEGDFVKIAAHPTPLPDA